MSDKKQSSGRDDIFRYDADAIKEMYAKKEWEKDVKYFKKSTISALAAMKMLKHALAGVKKGRASQHQTPIEVMGLLIGRAEGNTIVVMDAFPLPVEGIETSVEAGESAYVYMTKLSDVLEQKRQEGFVGWYHSHPFDVSTKPMYFMSAVDVGTQNQQQIMNATWTAIVVDPLRSLAKQEPQLGVFRNYPPSYNSSESVGPDGKPGDPSDLTERWGAAYNRYYMLEHSFFMSKLGNQFLDTMSRNNLWVRVLSSSSIMEAENRSRCAERIKNASDLIQSAGLSSGGSRYGGGRHGKKGDSKLSEGSQACSELATEQCCGHFSQVAKDMIFNYLQAQQKKCIRLAQ